MADFNASSKFMDWEKGFTFDINLANGLSSMHGTSKRFLSKVKGMFYDVAAADAEIAKMVTSWYTSSMSWARRSTRAISPLASASYIPAKWATNTT